MSSNKELSNDGILELIGERDDPALTAGEIAEEYGVSNQAANKRIKQLHSEGKVERKKVGAAAVVYWLPDD